MHYPATVYQVRETLSLASYASIRFQAQLLQTFEKFVESQSQALGWAYTFCLDWTHAPTIVHAIKNGKLLAISDGSFKEGFGTAFWILESDGVRLEGEI